MTAPLVVRRGSHAAVATMMTDAAVAARITPTRLIAIPPPATARGQRRALSSHVNRRSRLRIVLLMTCMQITLLDTCRFERRDRSARARAAHLSLLRSSLLRSPRRRQDPCEWAPGLGSAKLIACDATAGSDLDAVAASWTIGSEGDGCAHHRAACRDPPGSACSVAMARRAPGGPPQKAEPGAGAGPAAPQAPP